MGGLLLFFSHIQPIQHLVFFNVAFSSDFDRIDPGQARRRDDDISIARRSGFLV